MATYKENLFQALLRQLRLSHIEGEDRRIAFEIIGNINEDGTWTSASNNWPSLCRSLPMMCFACSWKFRPSTLPESLREISRSVCLTKIRSGPP